MTTKSHQELVRDFMILMEQISPNNHNVDVTNLTPEDVNVAKLRLSLIVEELDEMFEAFLIENTYTQTFSPLFNMIQSFIRSLEKDSFSIDRVAVTDSITDQDYINSGTGVWLNLPLEKSFQAVHTNNLTKVDPITGKVLKRADGKVIKPDSYVPVDLHTVVEQHDKGDNYVYIPS